MPHPKKRTNQSTKNQRRSHHALKKINLIECKKCGKPVKPHHACSNCGYYNSKEIIDVVKNLSKKEKAIVKKTKPEKKEENKVDKQ